MRNISVSYRFQFKIMHFICSYNYLSLFFLPKYDTCTYIKAIPKESKPRTSSDYKKNTKTTNHQLPILHLKWSISLRTVDFTEFRLISNL